MTRRLTATLLLVAIITSTVGCNGDDGAEPSTSAVATEATTTTTSAATTTEAPPTTTSTTVAPTTTTTVSTTTPPTTPPTIAADDWPAILTELSRRQVALYAAPDLSRIGEYCVLTSDCARQLEAQLGDAIARGQHIEGQQPFTIVAIENVLEGEPSEFATLTDVTFVVGPTALPPGRIVDASGNVVDELSVTTTNTRGHFLLAKIDDPVLPWRVFLAESLGPA